MSEPTYRVTTAGEGWLVQEVTEFGPRLVAKTGTQHDAERIAVLLSADDERQARDEGNAAGALWIQMHGRFIDRTRPEWQAFEDAWNAEPRASLTTLQALEAAYRATLDTPTP